MRLGYLAAQDACRRDNALAGRAVVVDDQHVVADFVKLVEVASHTNHCGAGPGRHLLVENLVT